MAPTPPWYDLLGGGQGEDWWQQKMETGAFPVCPAEALTPSPWRALSLRCLRDFKSYSSVLLLNQKMESQEKAFLAEWGLG